MNGQTPEQPSTPAPSPAPPEPMIPQPEGVNIETPPLPMPTIHITPHIPQADALIKHEK